jgi:hypothetical protein
MGCNARKTNNKQTCTHLNICYYICKDLFTLTDVYSRFGLQKISRNSCLASVENHVSNSCRCITSLSHPLPRCFTQFSYCAVKFVINWKNKILHFLLQDHNWCICYLVFNVIHKPRDQNCDGRIILNVHFHSEISHRLNMNSYMASLSSLHDKTGVEMIFYNSQACGHLQNLVFETVSSSFLEVW